MDEAGVDPEARYFNRLFGGRDLLVAGATVAAVKGGAYAPATKAEPDLRAPPTRSPWPPS